MSVLVAGRGDVLFERGGGWTSAVFNWLHPEPPAGRGPRAAALRVDGHSVLRRGERVLDGQRSSEVHAPGNRCQALLFRVLLSSLTSSFYSVGIFYPLCATCQPRKVHGRCCSRSTLRLCWWTSCHRGGVRSEEQVGVDHPGIPAWRRPAQPCSTSLSQSQESSGSCFSN